MFISGLEQCSIAKFKKAALKFRIRNYKSRLNLCNRYGLTPINFRSFSTTSDNADASSKSLSTAVIGTNQLPILANVSDLCSKTSNFRGGQLIEGVKLQRSAINYVFKRKHIKFDARTWAYVIVDYKFKHGDKEYTSIALPLFGLSSLESWIKSESSISKSTINSILKRLEIKPAKPEKDFQVYAGLLTEDQVAKVVRERPLEFDVDNYKAFCEKFKQEIDRTYAENCMPMFIYNDESIHSDHETCLITATLQPQTIKENNEDLFLISDIIDSEIPKGIQKISCFSQKHVVYLITYKERPNFYWLGHVDNRSFYLRLKEHASATGLTPIVVFAVEQNSDWMRFHPEQLEIDLQLAVARDLVESGFLEKFDLGYVRNSKGFVYNGSEADITRVCFTKGDKRLMGFFTPLSTADTLGGNKQLQENIK